MDQLRLAVGLGPGLGAAAFDQRQEGGQEGRADGLGEGEIGLPVAGVQVVVEDAADAAGAPRCGMKKYSSAQALKRA
jgi:hypothetical protein